MTISAPDAIDNVKAVLNGRKGPSPYRVAIFCTVGFAIAVLVIIFAILVPLDSYVDASVSEIVGCAVIMQDNEIVEVVVMGGTGVAELTGLYTFFNSEQPIYYNPPDKYEVGSVIYYQFDPSVKGTVGKLQIYGLFVDGSVLLLYDDTVKML